MSDAKEPVATSIAKAQDELEKALRQLQDMPAVDANSVAFAAHTLNNFLTVTGAATQMIMLRLGNTVDSQIKAYLESLLHSTDLMSVTVNKLMNASANQEFHLRNDQINLSVLVGRVCKYYQQIADRKSIAIHFEAREDFPLIWSDRVAFAAIMDNLVSNAVKYSERGKKIQINLKADSSWVECSVRDEGPGLSNEDQKKLFGRGSKLTPRPTGGETSTGYGLAVAQELIGKLKGHVSCESKLGHGSTFTVRIPIGAPS